MSEPRLKIYHHLWEGFSCAASSLEVRASSRNSQDAGWQDEVEERKGQVRDLWITEISGRLGDGV